MGQTIFSMHKHRVDVASAERMQNTRPSEMGQPHFFSLVARGKATLCATEVNTQTHHFKK